jgi:putative photosynthetic complex assembly protein 2
VIKHVHQSDNLTIPIFLDGLPRRTFRWSMLGATILLAVSLWGIGRTSHDATVAGAYWAFTCGLLAWGWQEISFYMGFVTGPRRDACPDGCASWRHFGHAVQTSLHHELAIIAAGAAVVALTWGSPTRWAPGPS